MIKFNKLPSLYWSNKTKMEYIQRRILVYSILYYKLNVSLVADSEFDEISNQLANMSKDFPEDFKNTRYYYVFYDFDGSSGFYLESRLNVEDSEYLNLIAKTIKNQRGL